MAEDGKVSIKTEIDESGVDKGLKNVKGKLNKSAKELNNLSKSGSKATSALSGTVGTLAKFGVAAVAVKAAVSAISSLSEAALVQQRAEITLATAVKNNPYYDNSATERLKAYASQLQATSTIGDETLIPFMSNLVNYGRSEAEVMDIMQTAVNMAESGIMDLGSAVQALNGTFQGNAGTLARQIPALKNLTTEQLKAGEGVKLLKEQYAGAAEEISNSVGAIQKMKNSWGDLKEHIGNGINTLLSPLSKGFGMLCDAVNNAISGFDKSEIKVKSIKDTIESIPGVSAEGAGKTDYVAKETEKQEKSIQEKIDELKEKYSTIEEDLREAERNYKEVEKKRLNVGVEEGYTLSAFYEDLAKAQAKLSEMQSIYSGYLTDSSNIPQVRAQGPIAQLQAKLQENVNEINANDENAVKDLESEYKKIIQQTKDEIDNRRKAGELITQETELQTILNKGQEFYVKKLNEGYKENEHIKESIQEQAENLASAQAQAKQQEFIDSNNRALEAQLKNLEIEAKAKGKSVSAQDKYNAYLQSYVALLTQTNGLIKEGYPIEEKRKAQLEAVTQELKNATDEEERFNKIIELTKLSAENLESLSLNNLDSQIDSEIEKIRKLKSQIESLSKKEILKAQDGSGTQYSKDELLAGLDESEKQLTLSKVDDLTGNKSKSRLEELRDENQKILDLKKELNESEILSEEEKNEARRKLDEKYTQNKKKQLQEVMSQINYYTSQAVSAVNQACDLMLEAVNNQAAAEQATLEEKYLKGEISEEEYNEKLTESKKKAAKEQYKIQMVQWAANLLQATANIALGVSQAISQGFPAGLITGGLVAAAGAVQIASIVASKPVPPKFASGGIVGGSSYSGDNIAANLNSREMVMNMNQQKGLWDFINGGSKGSGNGANITINNSASNIVRAQPRITQDQIEILIDARVNDGLKNGRYNQSLAMANNSTGGEYWGV